MSTADNLQKAPGSVMALAYNEESNIKACLESRGSLAGWPGKYRHETNHPVV